MTPDRILETCLYCPDLAAAKAFYVRVLELQMLAEVPGRHVFFRLGEGMFLLFNPAATEVHDTSGMAPVSFPLHGARGPGHAAFAIGEGEIEAWRARLGELGVEIELEFEWPQGGHSIYFRDPAGNSVELATPRLWGMKG